MSEINLILMQDGYLISEEDFEIVSQATKDLMDKSDFGQNIEAYLNQRKVLSRIANHPSNGNKVRTEALLLTDTLKWTFHSRSGKCSAPEDYKAIDIGKGPLTEQCRVKPNALMLKLGRKFAFKREPLVKDIKHYYTSN